MKNTAELPVTLLSPALCSFRHWYTTAPDHELELMLDNLEDFFYRAAKVYPTEKERMDNLVTHLKSFLGANSLEPFSALSGTIDLGVRTEYLFSQDDTIVYSPLLVECKNEIGTGSCCAYLQVSAGYANYVLDCNTQLLKTGRILLQHTNLPTLLVYIVGPSICVAAGTCFERETKPVFVVDVLMDPVHFFSKDAFDDERDKLAVARLFYALRQTIVALDAEYKTHFSQPPRFNIGMQPFVDRFVGEDNAEFTLEYTQHITRGVFKAILRPTAAAGVASSTTDACFWLPTAVSVEDGVRCAFTASVNGPVEVVVKFTPKYCADAHLVLARQNKAPQLYFCGAVPQRYDHIMVVMAQVDGSPCLARAQVAPIVEALHVAGFVWGDARPANTLVTADGHVSIIDFDWSGRQGQAKWPSKRNLCIFWPPGAATKSFITADQDIAMLHLNGFQ
jgi:hypothetical protein